MVSRKIAVLSTVIKARRKIITLIYCRRWCRPHNVCQLLGTQHVLQAETKNRHRHQLVMHGSWTHRLSPHRDDSFASLWRSRHGFDILGNRYECRLLCFAPSASSMAHEEGRKLRGKFPRDKAGNRMSLLSVTEEEVAQLIFQPIFAQRRRLHYVWIRDY